MVEIEKNKDYSVIKYKGMYLSSRFNPEKEAQRIYEKYKDKKVILLLGLGAGYLLKLLIKKEHITKIIILENEKEILNAVSKIHDINYNKVSKIYILKSELENIKKQIRNIIKFNDLLDFEIIPNNIECYKIDNEYYKSAEKAIHFSITETKTDFWTKLYLEKKWNENAIINLKHFYNSRQINNLINSFKNKPGILIGAGPSLNKNIKELNDYKNNFISVAVDTALRTCISNNFTPDFVYSLDCNVANYNDFIGINTNNLRIIYDIVTYPQILDTFKGIKYISTTGHYMDSQIEYIKFYDWFRNFIKNDIQYIQTGGSVSHSAFDFLRILGCNPIIIIGQDLAYTGFKCHSTEYYYNFQPTKFNSFETNFFNTLQNKDIFFIEGWNKDTVVTEYSLKGFLNWFEEAAQTIQNDLNLINSTEGGANINFFKNIKLSEALKKYCKKKIEKNFEKKSEIINIETNKLRKDINSRIIKLKNAIVLSGLGLEYLKNIYNKKKTCNYNLLNKYKDFLISSEKYFLKIFLNDYNYHLLNYIKKEETEENKLIKYGMFFKIIQEAAQYFLPYFIKLTDLRIDGFAD